MKFSRKARDASALEQSLVEHGLAQVRPKTIEVLYSGRTDREVKQRSMRDAMDEIDSKLIMYQYNKNRSLSYNSGSWSLFFWCRYDHDRDELDMSYCTLTVNTNLSAETAELVVSETVKVLDEKFSAVPEVYVTVFDGAVRDCNRIEDEARRLSPAIVGRTVTYRGMGGKIVSTRSGLAFLKKRARTRGYILQAEELLQLAWSLENTVSGVIA